MRLARGSGAGCAGLGCVGLPGRGTATSSLRAGLSSRGTRPALDPGQRACDDGGVSRESLILRTFELAERAAAAGDVPVGALVVRDGRIVAEGWNTREAAADPTGHAEINALRGAGLALGGWNLEGADLYVSLEPCTMCAGAIVAARIRRLVFGAWDPKAGAAGSLRDVVRDSRLNHQVEVVGGVLEDRAAAQLRAFFGR